MTTAKTKKRLVVNFNDLSPELQESVRATYPAGFLDAMIRVEKPNGDFFYAVTFETEDISYLVKIDVKIDDMSEEEEDKDYYDDDINGADDISESEGDERADESGDEE